jgi:hypothetical protein
MVAVSMTMLYFRPKILGLVGFDSTTPDKPNYWDAKSTEHPIEVVKHHDMVAEKEALNALAEEKTWLMAPTGTTVVWRGIPV